MRKKNLRWKGKKGENNTFCLGISPVNVRTYERRKKSGMKLRNDFVFNINLLHLRQLIHLLIAIPLYFSIYLFIYL